MQYGAGFPVNELADPGAARAFAQAAEALGFSHICVSDHILGADTTNRPGYEQDFPVTVKTLYHEPMALMGFLAGCTRNLGFATAIVQLPLRQAGLVAKQAAEVDLLCGGRLRFGVGLGRYDVEYEALNMDLHDRGRRIEEQIAVMRALWTGPTVEFKGRWHTITNAGINPLPVQRPIPIWFGGGSRSQVALKRIARLADGWFPSSGGFDELAETLERLRDYARQAGRDPKAIAFEGRLNAGRGNPDQWREIARGWEQSGAAYLTIGTQGAGYGSGPAVADAHIAILRQFMEAMKG